MTKQEYQTIEAYMLDCMKDSAHDRMHVYRVLDMAMMIAKEQQGADMDILIAACLLHDIGRPEQFADPRLCHAQVGGEKAYRFLSRHGWDQSRAAHVRSCIVSHRYRSDNPPATIEAKILFDADKLDVTGAIGIARTLLYVGQVSGPLYSLDADGHVLDGSNDPEPSFFQEYKFKLETLYDKFFTETARRVAQRRRQASRDFYTNMLEEVSTCHDQEIPLTD